ncbi:hypothetical protein [Chondromyces crocatus]|uniref:Uncharacterized protein n=1 Tax=Chondromyces crocatus TaxID=52 RepID=A0A0K1EJW9_CHOCO|nr:hypothetical protein [Chondromyces crocatus]AKT41144.1 uncharacterized protein CMC5_053050 [Chondromyces crocatus]
MDRVDQEAPILSCAHCGVGLRVDPGTRDARCRHCGASTALSERMREQARTYRERVEAELDRMGLVEAISQSAASGVLDRLVERHIHVFLVLVVMRSALALAPAESLAWLSRSIAAGVLYVGLALCVGLFWLGLKRALRTVRLEGDEPLVTPTAGAIAPTDQQADLAQARASRTRVREHGEDARRRTVELLARILWNLPLMIPAYVAILVAGSFGRAMPELRLPLLAGGVGLSALLLGGSVVLDRRGARKSRHRTALEGLASCYGTRMREDGTRAAVTWLDAHWAASTPEGALEIAKSSEGSPVVRRSVSLHHRDVAVLVMLAHAPHVQRLDVFLASYVPGRTRRADLPAADELRAAGFRLTLGPAGLHLLYPSSDARFCDPEAAIWMLERAVYVLHQTASVRAAS